MGTFTEGLSVRYYHNQVFGRFAVAHGLSGLNGKMYYTESEYFEYFESVRRYVPEKDRMDWNMKKHTLKDLCDFVGIKDHPGCSKPMPRVTVEILRFERNEPYCFIAL